MSKKTEKVDKTLSEGAMLTDANKKQQEKLYKTVKAAGGDIGMRVRADEKNKEDKMPNAIFMDNPWGSGRHIDTYSKFQPRTVESVKTINESTKYKYVIKTYNGEKLEDEEIVYLDQPDLTTYDDGVPMTLGSNQELIELVDDKDYIKEGKQIEDQLVEEAGLATTKGADQFKKFMKKGTKGKKKGKKEKGTKDLTGAVISTYESFLPKHLEDMYFWRDRDGIALNDDNWVKGTKEDFERPMFKNLPDHKTRHPYDVLRSGKWIETKDGKVVGQIDTMRGHMITLDIIDEDNKHQYVNFEINKLIKKIKDNELKINSNTTSKNKKVNMPWGKITIKENE